MIRHYYVFECCTKGRGTVIINGKEFSFGAGDAYILFPGDIVTHTTDIDDPREGIYCFANGLTIGQVLQKIGISSAQLFSQRTGFMTSIIFSQKYTTSWPSEVSVQICTAYLYHLFGVLLQGIQQTDPDTLTQKIIGIMEAKYNKHLTINQLADSVGLERSYFSTFLKTKPAFLRTSILRPCVFKKRASFCTAPL